jgi:hypothetical protein
MYHHQITNADLDKILNPDEEVFKKIESNIQKGMIDLKITSLTESQKLEALALKYYQGGVEWKPSKGDFYTTSRADLELYQIVDADENTIKTKYCDTDKGNSITEWKADEFLKGFGLNRVHVPLFIILKKQSHPQPSAPSVSADNQDFLKYTTEARDKFCTYIKSLDWNTEMRTRIDDFLICFDHLKERYAKTQHGKDK